MEAAAKIGDMNETEIEKEPEAAAKGPNEALALYKAFDALFVRLEEDETEVDAIRALIVANMTRLDEEDAGEALLARVREVARRRGYIYAQAAACAIGFYFRYTMDLDGALRENDEGLRLIREHEEYRRLPSYLSLLNNAALGYSIQHEYMKAYENAAEALELCEPEKNITTYCALLNNTTSILIDAGLYKKALRQMECSMGCIGLQADYNAAATLYRYGEVLLLAGKSDEAEKQILSMLRDFAYIFPWQIYPMLIRLAYEKKDGEALDRWYGEMLSQNPFKVECQDMRNALYAVGLHRLFHRNFEEAEQYFRTVEQKGGVTMLCETDFIRIVIELYEAWGHREEALSYYRKLDKMTRRMATLADDILEFELAGGAQRQRRAGLAVYERIRSVAELGQQVTDCLSIDSVEECLKKELGKLCPFDRLVLIVRSLDCAVFYPVGAQDSTQDSKDKTPWNNYPAIENCIKTRQTINLRSLSGQEALLPPELTMELASDGSLILQPLCYQQEVLGILLLCHHEPARYTWEHEETLRTLSGSVGVSLHTIDLYVNAVTTGMTDPLTGVLNRAGMYAHEKSLRARSGGACGLLLMDLDDFKMINDLYGHITGDDALRKTAEVLRYLDEESVVVRYGGDEFLLLVPVSSAEGLRSFAERLCVTVRENVRIDGAFGARPVTVSVGGRIIHPGEHLTAAVAAADKALYRAKGSGKNRVYLED